jgi:hypothetical protein
LNDVSPGCKFSSYANAPVGNTFTDCPFTVRLHVLQVLPIKKLRDAFTMFFSFNGSTNLINGLSAVWQTADAATKTKIILTKYFMI